MTWRTELTRAIRSKLLNSQTKHLKAKGQRILFLHKLHARNLCIVSVTSDLSGLELVFPRPSVQRISNPIAWHAISTKDIVLYILYDFRRLKKRHFVFKTRLMDVVTLLEVFACKSCYSKQIASSSPSSPSISWFSLFF